MIRNINRSLSTITIKNIAVITPIIAKSDRRSICQSLKYRMVEHSPKLFYKLYANRAIFYESLCALPRAFSVNYIPTAQYLTNHFSGYSITFRKKLAPRGNSLRGAAYCRKNILQQELMGKYQNVSSKLLKHKSRRDSTSFFALYNQF